MRKLNKKIGKSVKKARERAKLSQQDLAVLMGLDQAGLSRIEAGSQFLWATHVIILRKLIKFRLKG